MSESELSGDDEELKQLIAEYVDKETEETSIQPIANTKKSRKVKKKLPKDIEVPMDKVIFGNKSGLIEEFAKAVGEEEPIKLEDHEREKRKPAWIDKDDEELQVGELQNQTKRKKPLDYIRKDKKYKDYLTARFTRVMEQPKWAKLDHVKTSDHNSDDELLQTVGFLAKPASLTLPQQQIHCKHLKDLNRATYAEGSITSIQFHPTSTAALVAGTTGTATIYSIDGQQNEKLHSVNFKNFPIMCARIKPCGTKAIFGSVKHFFYSYDLLTAQEMRHFLPRSIATSLKNFDISPCGRYMAAAGRFGALHLFDAVSQELIHSFHQEDTVAGLRFTADSQHVVSNSKSCNISIFSIRQQRIEHTFIDDGCISGRVLDISPNQRLLATGSMEGVVNVYDFEKVRNTNRPLPEKTFLNLRTAISDVKFNHTSEILAMTAIEVQSAVKLAHFPSMTVFANFPGFNANLGKIRTVEFSPASGYMALGNRGKAVPLFRLKHFKNY